ncbi:MAG: MerR family transcriptional regulator [Desulfurella sp.]|uniref:helix-turn-helix domain-containing protein n=1 Tax=Desulfurella TaxID=33001 RepID=UPI0003E0BA90|nr:MULTISPECIES: MerR family transcriptional regulator [Desulfurella]AHF96819.1 MerR family transcriptional regulator [Desulfurella acetivorans A63]PMP63846.1 MAG: MerR family DNA-binding transcriptional regulator [Desulfurella multipotens]PMP91495.1 MAG: MerR family DNA-binding transcriptional regulator [Desulfurella sp.]HEX12933.1 MerR family transcriptional regulator [Desulfurella acetivorans]
MNNINNEEYFQIGEVSKKLGITPRTIRYYEEFGLLDPPLRIENGIRLYSNEDIRRIKFILKLKELGLTLKEMLELADIYNQHKQSITIMPKLIEILDDHIDKIDSRISKLASLRNDIVEYRKRILSIIEQNKNEQNK